jgi:hypothetical protein
MNIIMELARRRSTNADAVAGADLVVGGFCAEEWE